MDDKITEFNSTAYMVINHTAIVLNNLRDLHRLSCPLAYIDGAEYFKTKRDTSLHPNVEQYWHNRIKKLYYCAKQILKNLNPEDEQFFNITIKDIVPILNKIEADYEIFTYRLKN